MLNYWAYIHSADRTIHIKRWFPTPSGTLDDCAYAHEEKRNGNTNIVAIVGPFTSTLRNVHQTAASLFRSNGYNMIQVCGVLQWDGVKLNYKDKKVKDRKVFRDLDLDD